MTELHEDQQVESVPLKGIRGIIAKSLSGAWQAPRVAQTLEVNLRDVMPLMFAAITGQASSVSVLDAMEILGPDLTRFRLRNALELLGGASKKEVKEWEKLLASLD